MSGQSSWRERVASRGGRGRMGGAALGPGGECYCLYCGATAAHQLGVPCYRVACPSCGKPMTRKRQ